MTNQKKNLLSQLLKLSNLGIQMGLIIGLAIFLGLKADLYFKLEATLSVCFSLIGVFAAIFYAIKEVKKI